MWPRPPRGSSGVLTQPGSPSTSSLSRNRSAGHGLSVASCSRTVPIRHYGRVTQDQGPARWPLIVVSGLSLLLAASLVAWVLYASTVNHWLAVHTGTINESGPYYGFWSGFGSDIAEFGILGAIGTGIYQLVKKYNCHEPGCWRVGTHPAAGGQFLLCYRHHPTTTA